MSVLMSCSNICGRAILEPAEVGYATRVVENFVIVCDSNEIGLDHKRFFWVALIGGYVCANTLLFFVNRKAKILYWVV